jgi:hypothetical protein
LVEAAPTDEDQTKLEEVSEADKKVVEAVLEQATDFIVSEDLRRQSDEKASREAVDNSQSPSDQDANMDEAEGFDNCEEEKRESEEETPSVNSPRSNESKVAATLANIDDENKPETAAATLVSKQTAVVKSESMSISVKANGVSNGTSVLSNTKSEKSLSYYRSLSGKIRKFGSSYVFKQENIKSYTDTFGIDYKIGGNTYD